MGWSLVCGSWRWTIIAKTAQSRFAEVNLAGKSRRHRAVIHSPLGFLAFLSCPPLPPPRFAANLTAIGSLPPLLRSAPSAISARSAASPAMCPPSPSLFIPVSPQPESPNIPAPSHTMYACSRTPSDAHKDNKTDKSRCKSKCIQVCFFRLSVVYSSWKALASITSSTRRIILTTCVANKNCCRFEIRGS